MKKLTVILALVVVIMLTAFVTDKLITVKFTESQINYHWQNLNKIKAVIDQSLLPHNQAVYVMQSIDSLQKDIQINVSIDSSIIKIKK